MSAQSWLKRKKLANIQGNLDPSHGIHNGFLEAAEKAGWKTFVRMLLLSRSVEAGPWHEDRRFRQLQESWDETFKHTSWRDSPIFQEFVPAILDDQDKMHRLAAEGIMDTLWTELKEEDPHRVKVPEVNSGRFCTSVFEAIKLRKVIHLKLYRQLCLCIEMRNLTSKHLRPLLEQLEAAYAKAGEKDPGSAMRKGPAAVEAALRRSTANAMCAAVVWMLDEATPRLLRIYSVVCRPWVDWHTKQNSKFRSTGEGRAFFSISWTGGTCKLSLTRGARLAIHAS